MGATEQNPNFVDDVLKAGIKKDDKIIVACSRHPQKAFRRILQAYNSTPSNQFFGFFL